MKKQFVTIFRVYLLILAIGIWQNKAQAQTPFTITWTGLGGAGTTNASGVPTGITIIQQYNGVTTSCVTTPSNGSNTSYSGIIKAAAGYNVTITSIGGSAYGSSAGSKKFTLQLTNGATYTQTNFSTIASSSSCASSTTLNAFSVPAAGQLLTAGNQATVTVLRGIAGSESGGGYSYTRTLTITGVVTPVCDAPTNLAENNVTATSSDFNWDAGGANNYEYLLDQTAATPSGAGTALTTNSFSTSTLSPSTTYYFHLRRKCGTSNFSNWIYVNFTTPAAPCLAPTGLTAANTSFNSSDLSWDTQGSNSFEYVVDQNAADPAGAGTSTAGTSYNATALNPQTTYHLHVRTNCGSGNFSPWTTVSFTTLIAPCDAPTGLAAANITHNSADLSWNAQGSSTYEYVIDQVSTDPASGTATNGTTSNATSLTPQTTYYLHVRTNCVQGNTSTWTTVSFTTLIAPCDAPTGLTVANITHNSADLSWNAQGSSTYEYVIDQVSTDPASGTATNGTTYSAAGLNPSTTYYLHVRTNCVQGNTSAWTTISFTTLIAPCDAPTGLAAANITHNSADLSWNAQGSSTYEYVIDQVSTDPASGTATNGTTYSAAGLNPSTTYYLHVRTNCVQGNTSAWTTVSFTTLIAPCDAPTGLAAANITHNSADLSWNAQGSSTYEYVIDQVSTDPASGTATNGTTYNATSLTPQTTYYLHVRTNCVQGNTSPWTTISFTTLIAPCDAPNGLAAANITHNSADLSWNAQGSSTYEYVVDQVSTDPASGTATNGTTYNATSLTPQTTYYLHVRTNCVQGNTSPWTTVSFTTLIAPCDAPTGLAAANITYNSADLSWNAQGSSTYEYVVDQVSTDPASGTATNGTTYNATSLTPQTTYYLHVRTNCVQGNTSTWTTISFTTLIAPCDAPTGLAAANITHNSADLSWNAQGSSTYEYVIDQVSTDPAAGGTSTNATSYNATSLTPFTTYYLHVRTNCVQGNTSAWTTISFLTLVQPCDPTTGLTAANITHNSATLSWDAQGGNTFEYAVDQNATAPTGLGTPTTGTTYNAASLTPQTTYYLHVRTDCSGTNFSSWTTIPFTTLIAPCDAPTGLTAVNITQNSADLSWNAQGSSTYEYVVDQVPGNPASGTATNNTFYNPGGLSASTTYYLHVRTNCVQGNTSAWTTIPFTTAAAPCDAPTGLAAANTTHESSDLSWNIQGGNSFEYVLDQTATDPAAAGTPTTATSYHAAALNAQTTYYLHVRTDCGNGNFSDWTTISFTTTQQPCVVPTGVTASNILGHSANLTWGAQGANTFEYILNQLPGNPVVSGLPTPNNAVTATALNGATTYYFHIRTNCGNGTFSDWTTISFTTASTVGLEEQQTVDLAVYPNPASDQVTITGQAEGIITLLNVKGQQLLTFNLEDQNTLDLSAYESGIYFIRYVSENKTANIKVIKQ